MAQYKIRVEMPDVPKGEPVEFAHLGVFANGGTYDLDEDRVELWRTCVSGGHEPETFKIEEAMFPEGVRVTSGVSTPKDSQPPAEAKEG